ARRSRCGWAVGDRPRDRSRHVLDHAATNL
ncbi:MAG: hypothetical protein AVDCRST_MAG78-2346, partial [uncultured Rubrobacteraceae bacterium]